MENTNMPSCNRAESLPADDDKERAANCSNVITLPVSEYEELITIRTRYEMLGEAYKYLPSYTTLDIMKVWFGDCEKKPPEETDE